MTCPFRSAGKHHEQVAVPDLWDDQANCTRHPVSVGPVVRCPPTISARSFILARPGAGRIGVAYATRTVFKVRGPHSRAHQPTEKTWPMTLG
jgi:hypothetical protein